MPHHHHQADFIAKPDQARIETFHNQAVEVQRPIELQQLPQRFFGQFRITGLATDKSEGRFITVQQEAAVLHLEFPETEAFPDFIEYLSGRIAQCHDCSMENRVFRAPASRSFPLRRERRFVLHPIPQIDLDRRQFQHRLAIALNFRLQRRRNRLPGEVNPNRHADFAFTDICGNHRGVSCA